MAGLERHDVHMHGGGMIVPMQSEKKGQRRDQDEGVIAKGDPVATYTAMRHCAVQF